MITTTEESFRAAIYEALNKLDFAMSNGEIKQIQNEVINELKF